MKARTRGAATLVAVAVLALSGCGGTDAEPPKIKSTVRPGVAPTPPAQGAYFGAWVDPATKTAEHDRVQPGPIGAVTALERGLGREMDIVHAYRTWTEPFPRPADTAVLNSKRYLLLSWDGIDTKSIAAGGQDPLIRERARTIKATGKPVFLRWQWDMDRAGLKNRIHSPADYIAAWKRLRVIFRAESVDNVAWVWCPTANGFAGPAAAGDYYPGDDQVDWICADAYPGTDLDYRDLSEAMKAFMGWAKAHPKPVMVGEFGVPRAYGTRRADWLRRAARTLQNPQIKAVVYYDSDPGGKNADKRRQYSLSGDQSAMSAMRELATTPYFNPRNLPVSST